MAGEQQLREYIGTGDIQRELVNRRSALLDELYTIQGKSRSPVILKDIPVNDVNAVTVTAAARSDIVGALTNFRIRENESSGLLTVTYNGISGDGKLLFGVTGAIFENIGTPDSVEPKPRHVLPPSSLEFHTHVPTRPHYLHATDIPDLIGVIEGPAFSNPATGRVDPAARVFGILSVLQLTDQPPATPRAVLQLYYHNLKDNLSAKNHFGLRKFGNPVAIR